MATAPAHLRMLACAAPLARRLGALDGGLFSWKCGVAPPSTPHAVPVRGPWNGCTSFARPSRIFCFQMLFPRVERRRLSNYPPKCGRRVRPACRRRRHGHLRIFDSLNYLPNVRVAMEAVQNTHAICELHLLQPGDILDERRTVLARVLYPDGRGTETDGRSISWRSRDTGGLVPPYRGAQAGQALK